MYSYDSDVRNSEKNTRFKLSYAPLKANMRKDFLDIGKIYNSYTSTI